MNRTDMLKVVKNLSQKNLSPSAYRVALAMLGHSEPIDRYFVQDFLGCKQQQASRTIQELLREGIIKNIGKLEHSNSIRYNIIVVEPQLDGQMNIEDFQL